MIPICKFNIWSSQVLKKQERPEQNNDSSSWFYPFYVSWAYSMAAVWKKQVLMNKVLKSSLTKGKVHWSCWWSTHWCCVVFLDFTGRVMPPERNEKLNMYISIWNSGISKINTYSQTHQNSRNLNELL